MTFEVGNLRHNLLIKLESSQLKHRAIISFILLRCRDARAIILLTDSRPLIDLSVSLQGNASDLWIHRMHTYFWDSYKDKPYGLSSSDILQWKVSLTIWKAKFKFLTQVKNCKTLLNLCFRCCEKRVSTIVVCLLSSSHGLTWWCS